MAQRKTPNISLFSSSDQYLLSETQNTAHIYSRVTAVTAKLISERRGSVMPLSELQSPWTLVMRMQISSSPYHLASSLANRLITAVH